MKNFNRGLQECINLVRLLLSGKLLMKTEFSLFHPFAKFTRAYNLKMCIGFCTVQFFGPECRFTANASAKYNTRRCTIYVEHRTGRGRLVLHRQNALILCTRKRKPNASRAHRENSSRKNTRMVKKGCYAFCRRACTPTLPHGSVTNNRSDQLRATRQ